MSRPFERLAVIGLGLLGGSLGLAARSRGLVAHVTGASRSAETLETALARGAVDEVFHDPARAAAGADLVVLATPPFAMAGVVRQLATSLRPGAVVTDVGSVKAGIGEVLPGLLPQGVSYVGAHPMAGSHHRGVEHARADLFEGAACVLTPARGQQGPALERVSAFFAGLGARVVRRDAEAHDAQVAWISHAPHALAFAFARALAVAPAGADELAGSGFRDFTRIARSDPELWAEILCANQKALAGPLHEVARQLEELSRAIESGDSESILRFVGEAREALARTNVLGVGQASDPSEKIPAAESGPERSK
jgi:cyclohexadieny/prephenate dehydrogenase